MHDGPPPVLKPSDSRVSSRFAETVHAHESVRLTRHTVRPMKTAWIAALVVGSAVVFAGMFAAGWMPQHRRQLALVEDAEQMKSGPIRVAVIKPTRAQALGEMILPGEVQAVREVSVYARTNGYIKRWTVDIGDNVKAGQLLADIEAPEVDMQVQRSLAALEQTKATHAQSLASLEQSRAAAQQSEAALQQSKAQLANAQANAELADLTTKRYTSLRGTGGVTEQEISDKETAAKVAHTVVSANEAGVNSAAATLNLSRAAVSAAEAAVKASQANINVSQAEVRQSEVQKSFQQVTAPFDGKVTARQTEVGSLVSAGSGAAAQALFRISCINPVRVFINVPQTYTRAIRVGQEIEVYLRESPEKKYSGKVTRTANAIDVSTRTLRTEIEVQNPEGVLLGGMYAQVKFSMTNEKMPLLVPGSALIVNSDGTQVALVRDNKVHFQQVLIDSDRGGTVGVLSGITEDDVVIANPGERLSEGSPVTIAQPAK
jgi:RND family efflux transporter MFP subunit